ncbi:MAG: hypothetical protein ACJAUP_000069 [Cellvibrionaceae bacterium]|jgi:hypothetical protein
MAVRVIVAGYLTSQWLRGDKVTIKIEDHPIPYSRGNDIAITLIRLAVVNATVAK